MLRAWLICCAVLLPPLERAQADGAVGNFAVAVEAYVQGGPVPPDILAGGVPYDDPLTALGPPTVDTTGDGWNPPNGTGSILEPVPVVPIYPAFRRFEVVSIGQGGHLELRFESPVTDDPRNPCGKDFIIFGNLSYNVANGPSYWKTDPATFVVGTTPLVGDMGLVSVSQDGQNWVTFSDGPHADGITSTMGRLYDPDNPDPAVGAWNQWWGEPTCPFLPLDLDAATLSADHRRLDNLARRYGHSAGGTAFDLADVGLTWVQYVRIENPYAIGTPEIDALADVDPDLLPEDLPPDLDCDGDIDTVDVELFNGCATGPDVGPPAPGCERADLDDDDDIDQKDFGLFQRCFSGEDEPIDLACRG